MRRTGIKDFFTFFTRTQIEQAQPPTLIFERSNHSKVINGCHWIKEPCKLGYPIALGYKINTERPKAILESKRQ